jgi:hypothetical protein
MSFEDLTAPEWDEFFPDTCAIIENSQAKNDLGEREKTWTNAAGLGAVECQVMDAKGEQVTRQGKAVAVLLKVGLRGYFPQVTTKNRCTVNGTTYGILSVGHDSQHVKTTLKLEAAV